MGWAATKGQDFMAMRLIPIIALTLGLSACGGVNYGSSWDDRRSRAPDAHVEGVTHGSAYGGSLSFSDVAHMSEAFLAAMRGEEGTSRAWSNGRSGTRGEVIAGAPYLENVDYSRGRQLSAPVGIETRWSLEPAQGDYTTTTNTNVRLGATTASGVVETLPEGSVIEAVGRVSGAPWMLVARYGEAIGYMSSDFLEQRDGGDVLLAGGSPRQPVYCRTFEQSLSLRSGPRDRWNGTACQNARGQWRVEGSRGPGV